MRRPATVVLGLLLGFQSSGAGAGPAAGDRQFVPGAWSRVEELPSSRLRARLESLPVAARNRALRTLQRTPIPERDITGSLRVDGSGGVYYSDSFGLPLAPGPAIGQSGSGMAPAEASLPGSVVFHSFPSSTLVIHLDFDGADVTGTLWNTNFSPQRATIPALPYSVDTDSSTFNAEELANIKSIWQRVAEDFAPFNVDVTTEPPPPGPNTVHVLITSRLDANGSLNPDGNTAGGIAYVNTWGQTNNVVWCYHDNLFSEDAIAECAAHEVGHTLNLTHDGLQESSPGANDGAEYYSGHGSGDTSWAPIMGVGYGQNVTQWSAGNYYRANNIQNDRFEIVARLGYRVDDHGNTNATATPLIVSGGVIASTTPESDPANTDPANKGVMQGDADTVDVFSFAWEGPITLSVDSWSVPAGVTRGGNLDILARLFDAGGTEVGSSNPPGTTGALISTSLPQGTYFLHVLKTGVGNPLSPVPDGYISYGSKGQYFIRAIGSDTDADGVPDAGDNCPAIANALQADSDGDGRGNACDNCRTVPNNTGIAAQCDSGGDGFGNACDGDLNNNGSTNAQDTTLFRAQLGQPSVGPGYNPADLNCNGVVNAQDSTLFRQRLGVPPGPGVGP